MPLRVDNSMSVDDMGQWLAGCYVRPDNVHDGAEALFHVDGLDCSGDEVYAEGSLYLRADDDELPLGQRDIEGRFAQESPSELPLEWPLCGAVNVTSSVKSAALYVQRRQIRQWRRGYNHRCVEATMLGEWGLRKMMAQPGADHDAGQVCRYLTTTSRVAFACFYPSYPEDTREAFERLDSGDWASVALSPYVTLCDYTGNVAKVLYRKKVVGSVSRRGLAFKPYMTGRTADRVAAQIGGSYGYS